MTMCEFIKVAFEIALWHECSPVNLWHIFRTPFPKNTSGWLLLLVTASTDERACLFRATFRQLKYLQKFNDGITDN